MISSTLPITPAPSGPSPVPGKVTNIVLSDDEALRNPPEASQADRQGVTQYTGKTSLQIEQENTRVAIAQQRSNHDIGEAFLELKRGLDKATDLISKIRPDVDSASWEIKLQGNRLIVTGSIDESDKRLFEGILGSDPSLFAATQNLYKATVDRFDVESGRGARAEFVKNYYSGEYGQTNYRNVQAQLNSASPDLKQLVKAGEDYSTSNGRVNLTEAGQWGSPISEVMASLLVRS